MDEHVDFVIVGSYALGRYGVVRATGDIDVLYGASPANVDRIVRALSEFGAPDHLIVTADLLTPDMVTQIGVEPLRIDLLNAISGVTFDEAHASAVAIAIDGLQIPVIGLSQLRRNKQATGRPKDLADLDALARLDRNTGAS